MSSKLDGVKLTAWNCLFLVRLLSVRLIYNLVFLRSFPLFPLCLPHSVQTHSQGQPWRRTSAPPPRYCCISLNFKPSVLDEFDAAANKDCCCRWISFPTRLLLANLPRQLNRSRRHRRDHQCTNCLIDRCSGNRLAGRFSMSALRSVADIPGFLSSASRGVPEPEMPTTTPADSAALQ
jgi:hypothetical protein